MRALFAATFLLAAAPSCTDLYSIATHGLSQPVVTVSDAVATTSGERLLLSSSLSAANPNDFPLILDGVEYDVTVDGTPAASGTVGEVMIAGQGSAQISIFGAIDWATQSALLLQLAGETQAQFRIFGTARLETPAGIAVDVDFDESGTFDVPALPAQPQ